MVALGKIILCTGILASTPFHFPFTNTNIYSIEELSYYIYNNIYLVNEELFTVELADWLEKEADMTDFASKLRTLIQNKHSMKDLVVSLLCSADYYTENEIKNLVVIIDQIMNLDPLHRLKIKADNYLKYNNFKAAAAAYEEIRSSKDAIHLTEKEFGNLYHNQAIIDIHNLSFSEAAAKFKTAYQYNQEMESLHQYLYALYLNGDQGAFEQAAKEYKLSTKQKDEIVLMIKQNEEKAKQLKVYDQIQKIFENNKVSDITSNTELNDVIRNWKQEYRQEGYYEII